MEMPPKLKNTKNKIFCYVSYTYALFFAFLAAELIVLVKGYNLCISLVFVANSFNLLLNSHSTPIFIKICYCLFIKSLKS